MITYSMQKQTVASRVSFNKILLRAMIACVSKKKIHLAP